MFSSADERDEYLAARTQKKTASRHVHLPYLSPAGREREMGCFVAAAWAAGLEKTAPEKKFLRRPGTPRFCDRTRLGSRKKFVVDHIRAIAALQLRTARKRTKIGSFAMLSECQTTGGQTHF